MLNKYAPSGVVHCFSGSAETAEIVLGLGMYIGFTGALAFKNAKKKTIQFQQYAQHHDTEVACRFYDACSIPGHPAVLGQSLLQQDSLQK